MAGKFGPGLPCPSSEEDIIPQIGPIANQQRVLEANRTANPDLHFLSQDARFEVEKIAQSLEKDLDRLRIKDPIAIRKFLNFDEEQTVTGELTDEEIMEMVKHATVEKTALMEDSVGPEEEKVEELFLSSQEALEMTRKVIRKVMNDIDNTPEDALKFLGSLSGLEKLWQKAVMEKAASQPQTSILSFFKSAAV